MKPTNAIVAASQWYAKLASGRLSLREQASFETWKESDHENARAWQQVEEINAQFTKVTPQIGLATLSAPNQPSRRTALKHLGMLMAVGTAGLYAYREQPWRELIADYSTDTGMQHSVKLADGTQLHLNTDSAVNIRYSDTERVIELVKGEIYIETGHEHLQAYRPFTVQTQHGRATALGTRFNVRDHGRYTGLSVAEGAVRINPADSAQGIVVNEGEFTTYTRQQNSGITKAKGTESVWTQGMLVAYAMPLAEFTAELSRYRSGILRCDPAIGNLEISGAFPISNPQAVLESLTRTLPVKIETFTRYWTNIIPA